MRHLSRTLLCSVTVTLLLNGIACAYENQTFTITITTPHAIVKVGEPVALHVVLKSISKQQFKLVEVVNSSQAELNYIVDVRNAAGKLVPYTAYGREFVQNRIIVVSRRLDTLREGELLKEDMFLDKFVNLTRPGTYTIWLGRKDPLNSGALIKSNSLVIHVTK